MMWWLNGISKPFQLLLLVSRDIDQTISNGDKYSVFVYETNLKSKEEDRNIFYRCFNTGLLVVKANVNILLIKYTWNSTYPLKIYAMILC